MPDDEIIFEGMKLSKEKVEHIKTVRSQGQYIKDGIDLEHVHSYSDLVRLFKQAVSRAERESELDRMASKD